MQKPRLLRITTVPISLHLLLNGQFQFMKQQGFVVLTASDSGNEVAEVLKEGVDHAVISFTRKITPLRDLLCIWQLIVLIRKFKPHIVHTHTPKAGLLGMVAAWICRIPVRMHTVAGLPFVEATGVKSGLLRITDRVTFACAQFVYPNSRILGSYLQMELGVQSSKLKVLGLGSSNGINTSHFKPSAELFLKAGEIKDQYHIQPHELTFSFVGRIVKDKGIVELVSAFNTFGKDRPARLLLIGHFEQGLDPLPEVTMHFLRNDPRVVLAGFQKDVRPWLLASDAFVFPSYREGFPNVVMQACCMEIPCIVTDINGSNEIIQHNQTGLIVKAKDVQGLFEAMLAISGNAGLRRTFGTRAREFVSTNFDQNFVWGELLREYRAMLRKACIV